MQFSESLLHFIWRYRLFNPLELSIETGEALQILDVGQYNQDAGPDFELARIRIGDTLWSGHVEIHIREEDWNLHQHQLDSRYDNTILHVVWERSLLKAILRKDSTPIPTLVLADYVNMSLLEGYEQLMANLDWIPCAKQLPQIRPLTILTTLSRMAVGRLEQKFVGIENLLVQTKQNWELVFMMLLGRSFGMKVNASPFEELCLNMDLSIVHKHQSDRLKIESLIFGSAGFLYQAEDEYSMFLQKEYFYLKHLHGLKEMRFEEWRFLRMRPYNFPTYRLAQFAALLSVKSYWFAYVLEVDDLKDVFDCIDRGELNQYWSTHYRFGKETGKHTIGWSSAFKAHLAINCFVPMLFAYGSYMKEEAYQDKAIRWLNELPAEVNQITKGFSSLAIKCLHAADSQALLFLKKQYCDQKKCLDCAVGLEILKTN